MNKNEKSGVLAAAYCKLARLLDYVHWTDNLEYIYPQYISIYYHILAMYIHIDIQNRSRHRKIEPCTHDAQQARTTADNNTYAGLSS